MREIITPIYDPQPTQYEYSYECETPYCPMQGKVIDGDSCTHCGNRLTAADEDGDICNNCLAVLEDYDHLYGDYDQFLWEEE
jgi:hypothetical protein